MKARTALVAGVAMMALCGTASAAGRDPDLACRFRHKSRSVVSLTALPGPIRRYMKEHFEAMADRGEFFNATDVVERPGPFARFIRGGEIGEVWFAWYERGGIAYTKNIVLFGSDPSGTVHVIAEATANPARNLCRQTDALLDALY